MYLFVRIIMQSCHQIKSLEKPCVFVDFNQRNQYHPRDIRRSVGGFKDGFTDECDFCVFFERKQSLNLMLL
jgi:hypothetical protein